MFDLRSEQKFVSFNSAPSDVWATSLTHISQQNLVTQSGKALYNLGNSIGALTNDQVVTLQAQFLGTGTPLNLTTFHFEPDPWGFPYSE